jgi:hypothetical protein
MVSFEWNSEKFHLLIVSMTNTNADIEIKKKKVY